MFWSHLLVMRTVASQSCHRMDTLQSENTSVWAAITVFPLSPKQRPLEQFSGVQFTHCVDGWLEKPSHSPNHSCCIFGLTHSFACLAYYAPPSSRELSGLMGAILFGFIPEWGVGGREAATVFGRVPPWPGLPVLGPAQAHDYSAWSKI